MSQSWGSIACLVLQGKLACASCLHLSLTRNYNSVCLWKHFLQVWCPGRKHLSMGAQLLSRSVMKRESVRCGRGANRWIKEESQVARGKRKNGGKDQQELQSKGGCSWREGRALGRTRFWQDTFRRETEKECFSDHCCRRTLTSPSRSWRACCR